MSSTRGRTLNVLFTAVPECLELCLAYSRQPIDTVKCMTGWLSIAQQEAWCVLCLQNPVCMGNLHTGLLFKKGFMPCQSQFLLQHILFPEKTSQWSLSIGLMLARSFPKARKTGLSSFLAWTEATVDSLRTMALSPALRPFCLPPTPTGAGDTEATPRSGLPDSSCLRQVPPWGWAWPPSTSKRSHNLLWILPFSYMLLSSWFFIWGSLGRWPRVSLDIWAQKSLFTWLSLFSYL